MDEIKSTNFSPLTKDFIDIGRASCYGDTRRFRTELLPEICDKTILEGVIELNALTLLLNTEGSSVVPICR